MGSLGGWDWVGMGWFGCAAVSVLMCVCGFSRVGGRLDRCILFECYMEWGLLSYVIIGSDSESVGRWWILGFGVVGVGTEDCLLVRIYEVIFIVRYDYYGTVGITYNDIWNMYSNGIRIFVLQPSRPPFYVMISGIWIIITLQRLIFSHRPRLVLVIFRHFVRAVLHIITSLSLFRPAIQVSYNSAVTLLSTFHITIYLV